MKAAIIGLGRWGRRLVEAAQVDGVPKGTHIYFTRAVVPTPGKARDFAQTQALDLGSDYDAVLADPAIDAVVLATPHEAHPAQIVAAARAGKHIFVEKPLALSLAEALPAINAVRESGVVLALGHNRRFLPAAARLQTILREAAFGQLVHLEGTFCNNSGLAYRPDMWRAQERGPRSAMTAMGVHVLDFFIMLCGPVQSVRTLSHRRAAPVDVDDIVTVHLDFVNGVSATLTTMLTTPRQWRIQAYGTTQWAQMQDEHLLEVFDGTSTVSDETFEPVDTLRLELEAFAQAACGQSPYPLPIDQALQGTAALEAIFQSADAGGERVAVPQQ